MEPLRHIQNPRFGAVIFRRTYPEITNEGGMWDESATIYPHVGGEPVWGDLYWRFPSGARVRFGHLQYEQDKLKWQGAQIPLIGFDQLEHFSENVFWYMLSRNRSMCGIRPYIRATCNPDADSWLADFLAWWIDPESGLAQQERAGVVRWLVRIGERIEWGADRDDLRRFPSEPKSVTFVPARITDNRILLAADPNYLANLQALPPVDRARLLEGNWKIKAEAGKIFNRAWFEIVPAAPAGPVECRFWDFAATAKTQKGRDPDFTAGVKMRQAGSRVAVIDCVAAQVGPAQGDELFVNVCVQDALRARSEGRALRIRWEQEPGSSGIKESRRLVMLLQAAFAPHGLPLDAKGVRSQGDKLLRGRSLASSAQVGNVVLVAGDWNEEWLRHMHGQPDLPHDDIFDASAGAFNGLQEPVQATPVARSWSFG